MGMVDFGRVKALRWDDWNLKHIAKHGIEPEDAAEVVWDRPIIDETYKERLRFIGPNAAGRLLTDILGEIPGEPGAYYVSSARPASRRERREYAIQEEG